MTEKYPVRHSVFLSDSMSAKLADWAKARGHKVPEAIRMMITQALEPDVPAAPSLDQELSVMHDVAVALPRGIVRDWLGEAALGAGADRIQAEVIRVIEHTRSARPEERNAALREAQVLEYLFVAISNLIHQQYPKEAGKILEYAQARVLQHWSHLVDKGVANAKP